MLDPATVERVKARAGATPLVVALSGGGDSTALLHLLVDEFGASRVQAIVVDHGLREASHEDALRAQGIAAALGVDCEVLTLFWPHGPKRTQQAARRARYAVLCDAARRRGARVIALAHTADDQAETVLMRAAAGSGWRGLAGMAAFAPAPVWPEGRGIRLARPVLGVRRAALRTLLRARSADWVEDPANSDPAFERVRTRARLATLEAQGFSPMRLMRIAEALRMHAARDDREAARLIARAARFEDDRIRLSSHAWLGGIQVRRRALAVLVMAAAGRERAPEAQALARLEAAMTSRGFPGATLAGAVLVPSGGGIVLRRDPGALLGRADGAVRMAPLPLPPWEETVWDGRLCLRAHDSGWSVAASAPHGAPELRRHGTVSVPVAEGAEIRWLLGDHVAHVIDGD